MFKCNLILYISIYIVCVYIHVHIPVNVYKHTHHKMKLWYMYLFANYLPFLIGYTENLYDSIHTLFLTLFK